MNQKKSPNRSAVIDINSNYVGMTISQIQKSEISVLENLQYPLNLIHDVYNTGNISFGSMRALSEILSKFCEPIEMYGVGKVKLISYSVMREAKNSALVIDQISVQNDLRLEVLDTNKEKAYVFYEVIRAMPKDVKGNTLIAFVGAGSIGLVVYDGKRIVQSQEIQIGASRLYDMLADFKRDEERYFSTIEEYVNALLSTLAVSESIEQVVLTGTKLTEICELMGISRNEAIVEMDFDKFASLYNSVKNKTSLNLSVEYDIHETDASLLHSALFIYMSIVRLGKTQRLFASPSSTIPDAVTKQLLFPKDENSFLDFIRDSAVSCAEKIAESCGYNSESTKLVNDAASKIFDSMRKIHGLDKSNKTILKMASILYSCPALCNLEKTSDAIYDYIKNIDTFGLTKTDMLKIALVASCAAGYHPFEQHAQYCELSLNEQLTVKKLAAIFRISISLAFSSGKKLSNLKVALKDNQLTLKAASSSNFSLEKWAFSEYSDFFKDVFGVSPVLNITNN